MSTCAPTHTASNDRISVDYTITVPASAGVEVHSISGDVKVTHVQGAVRGETISGDLTMTARRGSRTRGPCRAPCR